MKLGGESQVTVPGEACERLANASFAVHARAFNHATIVEQAGLPGRAQSHPINPIWKHLCRTMAE